MKKIIFLALMAVIAMTASAQVEQGFRIGARAHFGATNVTGEGNKMAFGFGVGALAEYNFNPKLYLQAGIGVEDIAHKAERIDGTLNAYFLQIPIHVGYRFNLTDKVPLFIQAGPSFAYGISGTKLKWNSGLEFRYFGLANKFDFGLGGRVGVEIKKFQVSLGANYGVLDAFDRIGGHNLSLNLGVGYMFQL